MSEQTFQNTLLITVAFDLIKQHYFRIFWIYIENCFARWLDCSTSHSIARWTSHSLNQPLTRLATQSTSHSLNQPLTQPATHSTSHSVNQPLTQPVTHSTSHITFICICPSLQNKIMTRRDLFCYPSYQLWQKPEEFCRTSKSNSFSFFAWFARNLLGVMPATGYQWLISLINSWIPRFMSLFFISRHTTVF